MEQKRNRKNSSSTLCLKRYTKRSGTKFVANCPPGSPESSEFVRADPWIGVECVQIQPSYVVQTVSDLELRCSCSPRYLNNAHFTVVDPSYRLSRNTVSLLRHVECMVRRSRARFARDRALFSRVPLFLLASDQLVGATTSRNAPASHVLCFKPSCRIAVCCAEERRRID